MQMLDLVIGMTTPNAQDRLTMEQVYNHAWMQQEMASQQDVFEHYHLTKVNA